MGDGLLFFGTKNPTTKPSGVFVYVVLAQLVEQWTEDPCVASSSLALGMGTSLQRRHRQVVRQWIANPLSPVQIWVPPLITLYFSY